MASQPEQADQSPAPPPGQEGAEVEVDVDADEQGEAEQDKDDDEAAAEDDEADEDDDEYEDREPVPAPFVKSLLRDGTLKRGLPYGEVQDRAWQHWGKLSEEQKQAWVEPPRMSEEEKRTAQPIRREQWLQTCLAEAVAEGVFAIGGSIELDDAHPMQLLITCNSDGSTAQPLSATSVSPSSSSAPSLPVEPVIHWQLPLPAAQSVSERDRLMQAIVAQCAVATFGAGSHTVLDTSYRAAYQLPPSRFVTSFHPAQPGSRILADVARMLRPSLSPATPPAIQAELYSLNVYAAGGLFKKHVDTPRADNMFGSLVVCLPVPHQGGQLTVRHGGQSRVYDWGGADGEVGSSAGKQLRWAAFFGNCEHDVAPVTAGYRCTITYNLYQQGDSAAHPQQRQQQSTAPQAAPLDRRSVPEVPAGASALIRELRDALADVHWMAEGGLLGIKCAHSYSHTSIGNEGTRVQPSMLKGIDASLYAALVEQLHLGVHVNVAAESRERHDDFPYGDDDDADRDEAEDEVEPQPQPVYVSDVMHCVATTGDSIGDVGECPHFPIRELLPTFKKLKQTVTWLNDDNQRASKEPAVSFGFYGNQPGAQDWLYTEIALLVEVPPVHGGRQQTSGRVASTRRKQR